MSGVPASRAQASHGGRVGSGQMTVGQLAERTGLSRRAIRELEGLGLIYSVGRSDSNYRLFDEASVRCVQTIGELRGMGFTLAQIGRLQAGDPGQAIEAQLHRMLEVVRLRLSAQIGELEAKVARIDAFRNGVTERCAGAGDWLDDPCLPLRPR